MLGDGGVIEKDQSSGSTQPPISCIYSDKMPFHRLSPTVPGFSMGVTVALSKYHPVPLSHHLPVCGSLPLTKETAQWTALGSLCLNFSCPFHCGEKSGPLQGDI